MNVSNNNSSAYADASILTCGNNRLELSYEELVQLDAWLTREIATLNETVAKKTPPVPKFSLEHLTDLRYLTDANIEKVNERSWKYNEAIEKARANTTSARIGRLSVSTNAFDQAVVSDGKNTIEMGAGAWRSEKEGVESLQRRLRVQKIMDTFGEYPRSVNL